MKSLILLVVAMLAFSVARASDKDICKGMLLLKIEALCDASEAQYNSHRKKMSESAAKDAVRKSIKVKMLTTCLQYCGKKVGISCDAFSPTIQGNYVSCEAFKSDLHKRLKRVSFMQSEDSDELIMLLMGGQYHEAVDQEI